MDLFNYFRRETSEVNIGAAPLGGSSPIRIQSMTDTATQDTEARVAQAEHIVDAGGEHVRLTTRGVREAGNLMSINIGLYSDGYMVPLVAGVYFSLKVADMAAQYAERVRTNSDSYVDPGRTFKRLECTDKKYVAGLQKMRDRFVPFLNACKENHTAIRIGVSRGSLSDHIMSRYGNTPESMVESCMEFLRTCVDEEFTDVVTSIKASSTVVMVKTVCLLMAVMKQEGMALPLYLGMTEAGNGEDGRIKSASGIGALLSDGMGDTIRVSLSEEPEAEIPVARKLTDYIVGRQDHPYTPGMEAPDFNYLPPTRHKAQPVRNIGDDHLSVVLADRMDGRTETNLQFTPDYVYARRELSEQLEKDMQYILDASVWKGGPNTWSVFNYAQLELMETCAAGLKFFFIPYMALTNEVVACLKRHPEVVVISQSNYPDRVGGHRALAHRLTVEGLQNPVIFFQHYSEDAAEDLQIKAGTDTGALIFDGLCDGIYFFNQGGLSHAVIDTTAFGILQAGRIRASRTEYISCPGYRQALFNLQSTTARAKAATSHPKGLKVGIMGCIVNGPSEMADAGYGYVGIGYGKANLYKRKEHIEKSIPEEEAAEKLIELIKTDGDCEEKA